MSRSLGVALLTLGALGAVGALSACGGGDPPSSPAAGLPASGGDPAAPPASQTSGSGSGSRAPAPPGAPSSPSPAPPTAPAPPPGLACLAKYYVGAPTLGASGWTLHLPSGADLAWDDAETKTYDDALETPDLEDTLAIPYTTGAITPNDTVDLDPGRIRDDVLLKATFGDSKAAVEAALVPVDFVGQTVKIHARAAAALAKVSAKLTALVAATPSLGAYVKGELGGTFNWRPILNTTRMSPHSYGIAIDVVVDESAYWEWDLAGGDMHWNNQIPQAIVDAFESEGFAWGGRWYHYDTMHFEYRPELFDPACAP
jgi:hypothetical protein